MSRGDLKQYCKVNNSVVTIKKTEDDWHIRTICEVSDTSEVLAGCKKMECIYHHIFQNTAGTMFKWHYGGLTRGALVEQDKMYSNGEISLIELDDMGGQWRHLEDPPNRVVTFWNKIKG